MADGLPRRSALAHLPRTRIEDESGSARLRIELVTGRGYIHLRLRAEDESTMAVTRTALGGELPQKPNTVSLLPAGSVHWLGPDEWLVEGPDAEMTPLLHTLEERLRSHFAAVTDMTDAKAAFLLAGPAAVDLLRKGCSLDVHPGVFTPGACAQTALAKANVILTCVATGARYTAIVDRSDADYVRRWLEDAALEFTSRAVV